MHKENFGGEGLRAPKILYALVLCVFCLLLNLNGAVFQSSSRGSCGFVVSSKHWNLKYLRRGLFSTLHLVVLVVSSSRKKHPFLNPFPAL